MGMAVISSNTSTKIKKVYVLNSANYSPNAENQMFTTGDSEYCDIDFISLSGGTFLVRNQNNTIIFSSAITTFSRLGEGLIGSGKNLRIPPSCQVSIKAGAGAGIITTEILGTTTINSP